MPALNCRDIVQDCRAPQTSPGTAEISCELSCRMAVTEKLRLILPLTLRVVFTQVWSFAVVAVLAAVVSLIYPANSLLTTVIFNRIA